MCDGYTWAGTSSSCAYGSHLEDYHVCMLVCANYPHSNILVTLGIYLRGNPCRLVSYSCLSMEYLYILLKNKNIQMSLICFSIYLDDSLICIQPHLQSIPSTPVADHEQLWLDLASVRKCAQFSLQHWWFYWELNSSFGPTTSTMSDDENWKTLKTKLWLMLQRKYLPQFVMTTNYGDSHEECFLNGLLVALVHDQGRVFPRKTPNEWVSNTFSCFFRYLLVSNTFG